MGIFDVLILIVMDNGLSLWLLPSLTAVTVNVLILIVMDNGLSPVRSPGRIRPCMVLILIVMDNGLSR